ncbi:dual specificity protein phosphatase family protein [Grimontia sp. NTOU-MAR1]|uniref:dual specificity protein phosphatase family protein n=1 Tax=Grimontia sp. NTOU-MAR1 TaxID=3111011 RepID=UPI002DBBAEB9|nr:dual specificity protein phosphatase family protein [Grimontia sp. NTOU-MAR1]WRW00313.1 dual specificity protein phosphatase family protein [Grimontia sp. NTOU-MAR1]
MWDLDLLKKSGVVAVLSVNNGEMVHESRLVEFGIAYQHIPLSDNAPPQEGDLQICIDALPRIVRFVEDNKTNGTVVIHCRSGKDRTGLALAAYLMKAKELDETDAMNIVKGVRPIAFSAPGWDKFSEAVLASLR